MPRSTSPLNIFRTPDPTRMPYIVGRVPSQSEGRVLDVSYGMSPEGVMTTETTDRGRISESGDPFFYLKVFGGTLSMTQGDMHECVEELVYTREQKAKQRERDIATSNQLKNKVGDLIEAIKDAKVDRKHFGMGGK